MRQIESSILAQIAETLRLAGPGAAIADFDDNVVQQVLDIAPLIRRGGAGIHGGLWAAGIVNTHAGVDTQSNSVNPYAVVGVAGWQNPIPNGLDVWLIGPIVFTATVAANIGGGWLGLAFPADRCAFGVTSSQQVIGAFTGGALLGGVIFGSNAAALPGPQGTLRAYRIPRGATIRFDSTSVVGAVTTTARFIIGVFPAALGQDAIV